MSILRISVLSIALISACSFAVESKKESSKLAYIFNPFELNQPWAVSEKETLAGIFVYLDNYKWTVDKKYPEFEKRVKAANAGLDPKNLAPGQIVQLQNALNLDSEVKKQKALRQVVKDQNGVDCDALPLHAVANDVKILPIVREAVKTGGGIKVSTLLALWQKEGSCGRATEIQTPYLDAESAKIYAREFIYYNYFGSDYFTLYKPQVNKDNTLIADPPKAAVRFTERASAFGGARVPVDIMAQLATRPGPPGTGLIVDASETFYSLSLALVARYFQSKAVAEGPDLTYIRYNMGDGNYDDFVRSFNDTPERKKLGLVNWAIHSRIKPSGDWKVPRTNAVKFFHFRQCFLQYDK